MMSTQNGTGANERIKIDVLYKPVGSSDKYWYDFFILLYAEKRPEHLFPTNQVDALITVLEEKGVKQSIEKVVWELLIYLPNSKKHLGVH